MASKVQLTGGAFQDSMGNLLANGYLTMKLSNDAEVDASLICSGIELRIQLDANGSVVVSPAQAVWGNDQLLPVNTFYKVTGYSSRGQVSWGPNNQQVLGSGGTFDVGTWIPNLVIDWVPPLQVPAIEVNGAPTSLQSLINLTDSASVLFTNPSGGQIVATATAALPPVQVNGTDILASPADFVNSANVVFSNPSANHITATAILPPPNPNPVFCSTDFFLEGGDYINSINVTDVVPPVCSVMNLMVAAVFSKITMNVSTASAGTQVSMAIYSADGTTKIFDAGALAFDAGSIGAKTLNLLSPFTLPAGRYMVAWSTNAAPTAVKAAGIPELAIFNSFMSPMYEAAQVYGAYTNVPVGTTMPASLGTISWPIPGQGVGVITFIFYS